MYRPRHFQPNAFWRAKQRAKDAAARVARSSSHARRSPAWLVALTTWPCARDFHNPHDDEGPLSGMSPNTVNHVPELNSLARSGPPVVELPGHGWPHHLNQRASAPIERAEDIAAFVGTSNDPDDDPSLCRIVVNSRGSPTHSSKLLMVGRRIEFHSNNSILPAARSLDDATRNNDWGQAIHALSIHSRCVASEANEKDRLTDIDRTVKVDRTGG